MALPDYSDVEQMIFRGFLVEPAEIEGVPIVFKTLNQTEYDLATLYAFSSDLEKASELRECYFIASSVYLFNRSSVLHDREAFYHDFVEVLLDLPPAVRLTILTQLQKLNSRATEAIKRVEGFSYGYDSRQRWHSCVTSHPMTLASRGSQGRRLLV